MHKLVTSFDISRAMSSAIPVPAYQHPKRNTIKTLNMYNRFYHFISKKIRRKRGWGRLSDIKKNTAKN